MPFFDIAQGSWSNFQEPSFRQRITHIYQKLDLLVIDSSIQYDTQPVGLVHVPAGENAGFLPKRADQSGIALEIYHADFTLAGKSQILSGDIHNDGKPLSVPIVPEYQKTGIPGKKCLACGAVSIGQIGSQFRSGHRGPLPLTKDPMYPSTL